MHACVCLLVCLSFWRGRHPTEWLPAARAAAAPPGRRRSGRYAGERRASLHLGGAFRAASTGLPGAWKRGASRRVLLTTSQVAKQANFHSEERPPKRAAGASDAGSQCPGAGAPATVCTAKRCCCVCCEGGGRSLGALGARWMVGAGAS